MRPTWFFAMREPPVPSSEPAKPSAAPGFWDTPFGSAEAVAAAREFSELQSGPAGLFWLEYDPATAAQCLCHYVPDRGEGSLGSLTGPGTSVRSRVNEYGGGAFCVSSEAVFFVDERSQQVYRQTLGDSVVTPLTDEPASRFGDLFYDAAFERILCVREQHGDAVTQDLVAINVVSGAITGFASGADFYASPRVDAQGRQAAWIEWSLNHMPWDRTRLARADLVPKTGAPEPAADKNPVHYLSPGREDRSILQPRFDELGRLWCISDHQGWWQLYRIEESGAWVCFDDEEADRALPPSQLGQQQYAFLPGRGVASTKLKRGWMHLEVKPHDGAGATPLLPDYSLFRHLQHHGGRLYCIAGAPDRSTSLVEIDPDSGGHRILAGGAKPLPDADIARPETFSFAVSESERAHGFFYRPANSGASSFPPHLLPVVVMTHGGPTSATYAVFNPMIQFWTQRGFAVADLNYRGSSGFGRAYRQALHHCWGVVDVKDVLAALDELGQRRWCDTARSFIRGSSAGGFTTLSVVAASDRFLGGCSLYGVSDPWALRQATHRFESRYLDWLIADPSQPERFEARAPIKRAKSIRTPLIFFQGGRDSVVVPAQTESMVAALKAEGLDVSYHYYPDEGHGFRRASTRQHALEQELAFFQRQLIAAGAHTNG